MAIPRHCARLAMRCTVACAILAFAAHPARAEPNTSGWPSERTVGPFTCRADFPLTEYESLLPQLSALQSDLNQMLGVERARETVELYLFAEKDTYRRFLQARMPTVPDRRALFLKGSGPGRVFVFRSAELAVDVRHESTHALLHASLPMVPLWLDEGLAEYFEVPPKERPFRKDYLKKLKWNVRLGTVPRLTQLEAKRDLLEMGEADYRYAWAWVHFMLHGPREAHDELVNFLADIHASTPPGTLSQRLERRLPRLDKRLVDHLRAWKISQ